MKIKLFIKFNRDTPNFKLIDKVLKIPECKHHKIGYDKHGIYEQKGEISYPYNEFLSKITQIVNEENMEIVKLKFKIKK